MTLTICTDIHKECRTRRTGGGHTYLIIGYLLPDFPLTDRHSGGVSTLSFRGERMLMSYLACEECTLPRGLGITEEVAAVAEPDELRGTHVGHLLSFLTLDARTCTTHQRVIPKSAKLYLSF